MHDEKTTEIGQEGGLFCVRIMVYVVLLTTGAWGQTPINFPDLNLEAAIRRAINKPSGTIYDTDVAPLMILNGYSCNISNLSGLQYCGNLRELDLYNNRITSITPLAPLANLTYLSLGSNQIADITSLSGLPNLTFLNLSHNQIVNIGPIAGCTNLAYLYLSCNRIADIGPVAGFISLTHLETYSNMVSDISALVANAGLGTNDLLWLQDNPLGYTAVTVHIPQLQARGVVVSSNAIALVSVAPNSAWKDGPVQIDEIRGAYFTTGTVVQLQRKGQPSIAGSSVDVASSQSLSCTFNLRGAVVGPWDVCVRNPNGFYGRLRDGFTIYGEESAARFWHLYDHTNRNLERNETQRRKGR